MSEPPAMPPPLPWDPEPDPEPDPVPSPPPGGLFEASPFDSTTGADGQPIVDRPQVPEDERERLVQYLTRAPVVLAARGFGTDRLAPDGRRDVPQTFHTDGTWVWAGAVAYYLEEHALPPVPGLVAHARAAGFQVPEVSDEVKRIATRIATGEQEPAPHPPSAAAAPRTPVAYPPPGGYPPAAPGAYPPGVPVMPPGAGFAQPPRVQDGAGSGKRIGIISAVSAISVVVASALLLGVIAISNAGREETRDGSIASGSPGAAPSAAGTDETSPATVPSTTAPPLHPATVTSLPELCGTIEPSLPAKVRGIELETVIDETQRRFCRWQRIDNRNGRNFEVEVHTHIDPDAEQPASEALEDAKETFRRDWEYAGESKYNKSREKLSDLGDEAFAAHHLSLIARGPDADTAYFYWLGGVKLEVRKANVIIKVDWQAADNYSSGPSYKGRNLPYETAKKKATEVARKILAILA